MKVYCKNMVEFMERLAPPVLAEEWDNVGLMLGNAEKEVRKVLLCLDVTADVVEEAVGLGIDLIISHHPFIFKKLGRINEEDVQGRLIYKLIKGGICVYSAHTNLDVAESGVNRTLAAKLELEAVEKLKEANKAPLAKDSYGLGAVGYLKNPINISVFAAQVKEKLDAGHVRVIGDTEKMVHKIAVFCGSFDGDLAPVVWHKADVLVTGDVKYHTALDALSLGLCIMDAGHFNTEKIILPVLGKLLKDEFPEAEIICTNVAQDPFKTY